MPDYPREHEEPALAFQADWSEETLEVCNNRFTCGRNRHIDGPPHAFHPYNILLHYKSDPSFKWVHGTIDANDPKTAAEMARAIHSYNNTRFNVPDKTQTVTPAPESILDEATRIVNSDRQAEYSDPVENHVREAIIATVTLGKPITPPDVVKIMHAKKLARSGRGYKRDNVVDKAGYAEIEDRVEKAFADGTVQKIVEKLLGGWVKFNPEPYVIASGMLSVIDKYNYPLKSDGTMSMGIRLEDATPTPYRSENFGKRVKLVIDE
jgi:hypothetical protein